LHYPRAVSDLRVCGYGDMQLQVLSEVRVSSYSHVALIHKRHQSLLGGAHAMGIWQLPLARARGFHHEWSDELTELPVPVTLAEAQVARWQSKYGRDPTTA
jgi:hypothetical protein